MVTAKYLNSVPWLKIGIRREWKLEEIMCAISSFFSCSIDKKDRARNVKSVKKNIRNINFKNQLSSRLLIGFSPSILYLVFISIP